MLTDECINHLDRAIEQELKRFKEKVQTPPGLARELLDKVILLDKTICVIGDTGLLLQVISKLDGDTSKIWVIFTQRDEYEARHEYGLIENQTIYISISEIHKLNSLIIFNGMQFDVIIGNPPFNAPHVAGKNRVETIWQKFALKAFSLSKDHVFLSHRAIGNTEIFLNLQIHHLN